MVDPRPVGGAYAAKPAGLGSSGRPPRRPRPPGRAGPESEAAASSRAWPSQVGVERSPGEGGEGVLFVRAYPPLGTAPTRLLACKPLPAASLNEPGCCEACFPSADQLLPSQTLQNQCTVFCTVARTCNLPGVSPRASQGLSSCRPAFITGHPILAQLSLKSGQAQTPSASPKRLVLSEVLEPEPRLQPWCKSGWR